MTIPCRRPRAHPNSDGALRVRARHCERRCYKGTPRLGSVAQFYVEITAGSWGYWICREAVEQDIARRSGARCKTVRQIRPGTQNPTTSAAGDQHKEIEWLTASGAPLDRRRKRRRRPRCANQIAGISRRGYATGSARALPRLCSVSLTLPARSVRSIGSLNSMGSRLRAQWHESFRCRPLPRGPPQSFKAGRLRGSQKCKTENNEFCCILSTTRPITSLLGKMEQQVCRIFPSKERHEQKRSWFAP
jgi:hypothetical protein